MAIKLSDLQKRTRTIKVKFQGDELTVKYKMNIITPAFLAEKLEIGAQLAQVIESWDLLDEEGNQIAITAELFETLPTQFQADVMVAITDDMSLARDDQKKI